MCQLSARFPCYLRCNRSLIFETYVYWGTYFGITHFLYFWYLRVKSSDWLFIFRFDQPDFDELILEEMRYDHYQFALAPLMVLFGTNTCRCRLFSLVLKAMEEDRSRSVKDSLNLSKDSLHLARLDTLKSQKGKTQQNNNMHNLQTLLNALLIRPGGTVSSPPSVWWSLSWVRPLPRHWMHLRRRFAAW